MSTKTHGKDLVVIAIILAVAAILMLTARVMPRTSLENKVAEQTLAPDAIEYLDETGEPDAAPEQTPDAAQRPDDEAQEVREPQEATEAVTEPERMEEAQVAGPMPAPQAQEIRGYAVITVNGRQYGDPVAMDRDKIITVRQEDGKINRVHITPDEVYMESSTCDNQDCVGEGNVTHDNYETRILGPWIICLPNAVTIEYIPAED